MTQAQAPRPGFGSTEQASGPPSLLLALALLAAAGFTDAVGLLGFGLYPSFMSGNSTNLAVALAHGERPRATVLASAVVIFVAGAFLGRLVRLRTRRRAAVLVVEAALLSLAGLAALSGVGVGALACATLAMGAQNAALSHAGDVKVGTYVTGALARLGSGLADALAGGERWAWVGDALLWAALVAGAVAGAGAFRRLALLALLIPAAAALALAAVSVRENPDAAGSGP